MWKQIGGGKDERQIDGDIFKWEWLPGVSEDLWWKRMKSTVGVK